MDTINLARADMEAVVLLHCSGSSGAQWRALAAKLAGRYTVVAPDLIGYGAAAPWPGQREFSLAQEAAPVLDMLGRLGSAVLLVGLSYGGAVALLVAGNRADALRTL